MEEYTLKSKDMEQLSDVIKTSLSIYNLYQRLYKLELEGKKNTNEYLKNMDYLALAIEVEEREYKKHFDWIQKGMAAVNYIMETYNVGMPSVVDDILVENNGNIIFKRIITDLSRHNMARINASNISLTEDVTKYLSMYGINMMALKEAICQNYKRVMQTEQVFEKETNELFLTILHQYMKNNANYKIYSYLLKVKYDISFTNKWLEGLFLDTNFDIFYASKPNNILNAKELDLDAKSYVDYRHNYNKKLCLSQIYQIFDSDGISRDIVNVDLLLRHMYLATGLISLDKQTVSELYDYVHAQYDNDELILETNRKLIDKAFSIANKHHVNKR